MEVVRGKLRTFRHSVHASMRKLIRTVLFSLSLNYVTTGELKKKFPRKTLPSKRVELIIFQTFQRFLQFFSFFFPPLFFFILFLLFQDQLVAEPALSLSVTFYHNPPP